MGITEGEPSKRGCSFEIHPSCETKRSCTKSGGNCTLVISCHVLNLRTDEVYNKRTSV